MNTDKAEAILTKNAQRAQQILDAATPYIALYESRADLSGRAKLEAVVDALIDNEVPAPLRPLVHLFLPWIEIAVQHAFDAYRAKRAAKAAEVLAASTEPPAPTEPARKVPAPTEPVEPPAPAAKRPTRKVPAPTEPVEPPADPTEPPAAE